MKFLLWEGVEHAIGGGLAFGLIAAFGRQTRFAALFTDLPGSGRVGLQHFVLVAVAYSLLAVSVFFLYRVWLTRSIWKGLR